jgi:2-polyprenyl-6-methoxyphenol hydroxylase-like FAD-dependent oxidoreductase
MTTHPTVLISGAGIGGTTLAYWLARHGFRPTIVERAAGLRSSGNPVDVRGPAVAVAERMGVMPRLRGAAAHVRAMSFVNSAGREVGRVNMRALQQLGVVVCRQVFADEVVHRVRASAFGRSRCSSSRSSRMAWASGSVTAASAATDGAAKCCPAWMASSRKSGPRRGWARAALLYFSA